MIRLETDGDLCVATLTRPDKANALTREMLLELAEIVERAEVAKVLVLTGEGKVFSAGADLDAAKAGLATDPVWERLSGAIADFKGLSIAALNGSVAGGALGMVLACDLRVAVPGAKLFYPVMKLGFLPQPSDPKRMAALIGPARTKLVFMGGAKLTMEEALDYGLVDRLVDDPMAEALALAADVLGAEPAHVQAIKAMIP